MKRRKIGEALCKFIVTTVTIFIFIISSANNLNPNFISQVSALQQDGAQQQEQQGDQQNQQLAWQARQMPPSWSTSSAILQPPNPIASASYLSLDGLSLVIIFDKPVNLTSSIESVERRLATSGNEQLAGESSQLTSQSVNVPNLTRSPRGTTSPTTANEPPLPLASDSDDQSVIALANGSELDQYQRLDATGVRRPLFTCPDPRLSLQPPETSALVQGIQICARLLTKKTLKLLHKYRLYNCIWPTQVQFIIQLGKSVPISTNNLNGNNNGNGNSVNNGAPIRVAFKRSSLSSSEGSSLNEREVSVELNRLPLEGLGVPLTPKLALTGPNQVPPCGQFSLSAHLSSPYGTQPGESISLTWSVERIGLISLQATGNSNSNNNINNNNFVNNNNSNNASQTIGSPLISDEAAEVKWRTLQRLVVTNRGNNLLLDAQLLQHQPQVYLFHVTATYTTPMATTSLNATHQVGKIDFEAPIGTIYGSHLLSPPSQSTLSSSQQQQHHHHQQQQVNPSQETLLLAEVQVPECANNIKQVGVYWQVSDSRVKFEQTYAPFYLIKKNALPEQASIEFRLNLFYGIRVKKYASAGTLILTGDSILDASINDGTLVMSVGNGGGGGGGVIGHSQELASNRHLDLYAASPMSDTVKENNDRYTYQWSCFDGKTAQQCVRNPLVASNTSSTRYEIGSILAPNFGGSSGDNRGVGSNELNANGQRFGQPSSSATNSAAAATTAATPLLDRQQQRQMNLKLPLGWLEPEAQLWFGLQRFDRQQVASSLSGGQQQQGNQQLPQAKTVYALVSVQQPTSSGPTLSIGPVLIGRSRHLASVRNPLTGAIVLVAGAPVVVIGRLANSNQQVGSFAWHMQNGVQPLYWTVRNSTNPVTGEPELITELQLNQNLLVAHAHHQIQLIACSRLTGAKSSASLSLDIVQSVSQCRVEVSQNPLSKSLVVSVEFCNLPLGLSPASYQIYVLDTTNSDGFLDGNNKRDSSDSNQPEPAQEQFDEYANEADESYLESQAEPLTVPQFSPVFVLNGLSGALGLFGFISSKSGATGGKVSRVRFGARVCDRLQSCRMFYSRPIGPEILLPNLTLTSGGNPNGNNNPSAALSLAQQANNQRGQNRDELERSQSVAMQSMIDGAKRANMAGSSIAAISVLNGVITLASKTMQQVRDNSNSNSNSNPTDGVSGKLVREDQNDLISSLHADKLRQFNLMAMRDCLHYTSLSLQRHFHYTDSGQTNLVTQTLAKILASQESGLEFKFRALRLLGQVSRRSVEQSLNLKQNCLADLRSIQSGYESIFGTFNQYSVADSSSNGAGGHKSHHRLNQRHSSGGVNGGGGGGNHQAAAFRSNSGDINNNNSDIKSAPSINVAPDGGDPIGLLSPQGSPNVSMSSSSSSANMFSPHSPMSPLALAQQAHLLSTGTPIGGAVVVNPNANSNNSRRKREEAILAYLRYARQAYRSLVAAVAVQLPLGASHQLAHFAGGATVSPASPATSGPSADLESRGARLTAASSAAPATVTSPLQSRKYQKQQQQQQHKQQKHQQVVAPGHVSFGLASLPLQLLLQRSRSDSTSGSGGSGGRQQHSTLFRSTGTTGATQPTARLATGQMLQVEASNLRSERESQQTLASNTNQQVAILSSLAHQTQLSPSEPIDVDLNEFGSVSILFQEQAALANKLRTSLERRQLRCRNDTATPTFAGATIGAAASGGTGKSTSGSGCSSFVLALTTFTGKAPFRSLDEGAKWLRVPIVELSLLSPIDGSNLQDFLLQSADSRSQGGSSNNELQLQASDFKAIVTYTLPAVQFQNSDNNQNLDNVDKREKKLKCYKFSEELNEWQVSEVQQEAEESLLNKDDQSSGVLNGDQQSMRIIKCSFNSLGVYGAFVGQPPSSESSLQLTIILSSVALFGLVAVFSILGCFASSSKSSSSNSRSSVTRSTLDVAPSNDDHYTGSVGAAAHLASSASSDLSTSSTTSTIGGQLHNQHSRLHDRTGVSGGGGGNLRAFGQYPL